MQNGMVHRVHADITGLEARKARAPVALLAYGDALQQEWRMRTEAGPAGPALLRADHPNYLGSQAVVRGLVDGYIALLIARAAGAAPHAACEAEVHRLSRIFAGIHPAYAPIGGWNTLQQLGHAALRRVPLEAGAAMTLPEVLSETFAATGLAVFRILRAAEDGLGADAALARLSLLASRLGKLLLGALEAEPAAHTLLATVSDLPDLG